MLAGPRCDLTLPLPTGSRRPGNDRQHDWMGKRGRPACDAFASPSSRVAGQYQVCVILWAEAASSHNEALQASPTSVLQVECVCRSGPGICMQVMAGGRRCMANAFTGSSLCNRRHVRGERSDICPTVGSITKPLAGSTGISWVNCTSSDEYFTASPCFESWWR